LKNDSTNKFPRKQIQATIEEPVSMQRLGKHSNQRGIIRNNVFWGGGAPRLYNEELRQLRNRGAGNPSAWGYNRATLFLWDINTET
jgi:hypothetical protein